MPDRPRIASTTLPRRHLAHLVQMAHLAHRAVQAVTAVTAVTPAIAVIAGIAGIAGIGAFSGAVPCRAADPGRSVRLRCPAGFLPGVPILVQVEILSADGAIDRDIWDATAVLSADPDAVGLAPPSVRLYNGLGSALVAIDAPAGTTDITLTAAVLSPEGNALEASRTVQSLDGETVAPVSGTLPAGTTEWSGVVHVTANVTVPADATLALLPGALVLVEGVTTAWNEHGHVQPGQCGSSGGASCGASIRVQGTLDSRGTLDAPVTITARDPEKAWGEIHHDGAEPSVYRHTLITRAGNSPREGHTSTGPAVRATSSRIRFEHSAIADTAGKAMTASGSDIEYVDSLISRVVMGPEVGSTAFLLERSWIAENHGPDDNDGIYFHGQRAGQTIAVKGSVVAACHDDGIDTLDSIVTIEDTIVRDCSSVTGGSKGISVLAGRVDIRRCLLVRNEEGIVGKGRDGDAVRIDVERTTVTRSATALHAWDKYGAPNVSFDISVRDSILDGDVAVESDYDPVGIEIHHSALSTAWAPGGVSGEGNIVGDPLFVDPDADDYRLRVDSPCIDAGDPASAPDPDGSRADMGYAWRPRETVEAFLRGHVNADEGSDISDAVTILLLLFGGAEVTCRDAADTNDDGRLDVSDAVTLLRFLFLGEPAPPAPTETCGPDPTEDDLDCAAFVCP